MRSHHFKPPDVNIQKLESSIGETLSKTTQDIPLTEAEKGSVPNSPGNFSPDSATRGNLTTGATALAFKSIGLSVRRKSSASQAQRSELHLDMSRFAHRAGPHPNMVRHKVLKEPKTDEESAIGLKPLPLADLSRFANTDFGQHGLACPGQKDA